MLPGGNQRSWISGVILYKTNKNPSKQALFGEYVQTHNRFGKADAMPRHKNRSIVCSRACATGSSATAARRFSANRAAISKGFGRVDRAEAELCCPSFGKVPEAELCCPSFGEGSGKRLFKLRQAGCSGLGFFCLLLSSFTRAACLCYNVMFGLCFTCVLFIIACSTFVLIIFVFHIVSHRFCFLMCSRLVAVLLIITHFHVVAKHVFDCYVLFN